MFSIRNALVFIAFVNFFGCKTTASNPENSSNKSYASQSDIGEAYRLIGGLRTFGDCKTNVTIKPTKKGKKVFVEFNYKNASGNDNLQKLNFSNHERHLSRVDVVYGLLGLGKPKKVVLERIVANTAPAPKYKLTYLIEQGRPTHLEFLVAVGRDGNVINRINCL